MHVSFTCPSTLSRERHSLPLRTLIIRSSLDDATPFTWSEISVHAGRIPSATFPRLIFLFSARQVSFAVVCLALHHDA